MSGPEDRAHDGADQAPLDLRDAEAAPAPRTIAEILDRLPAEPGVYIMKDRRGKPIYVGKAASLRARVRQYFQPSTGDQREFVPLLEGLIGDIETIVTSNEKEALLLENTLIKRYQPRFNVNLRDDKSYLVLRLDTDAEWPRLEVVRRMGQDGAAYFGPYHSAGACREALRVVNRHFQLRTCTDHVLHNRKRPCLQYQIRRCPGPCVLPVARDEYAEQVRDVRLFLEGRDDELLARLNGRMQEAAEREAFEQAAELRDQIRALQATLERQRVVSAELLDQDVIGFHRQGPAVEMVVMSIRQGKLLGSRAFSFGGQEFPDAELLSSFVGLFYDVGAAPPDEVLLPFAIDDAELKAEWLSEKRQARRRRVEVLVPQRGPRHDLVNLAQKNAAASFATRRNQREDAEVVLGKLQRRLRLPRLPRTIECYDISHIQGFAAVASMVVFVDGQPEKSRYRTYKIRQAANRDDFASMYEVLSRRLRRAREGDEGWELPDLIVVDGGKGQLGMALAAARDVGIDLRPGTGLPIIGLAKERELVPGAAEGASPYGPEQGDRPAGTPVGAADTRDALDAAPPPVTAETPDAAPAAAASPEQPAAAASPEQPAAAASPEPPAAGPRAKRGSRSRHARASHTQTGTPDRVFLPNIKDPIPVRPNTAEMFVLQHLRDEAHRFAITFHRSQRRRRTLRSALGEVPGIGPARQRELLRTFGSLKKLREASLDELVEVPGMTRTAARAVLDFLASRPDDTPAPEPRHPAGEAAGALANESAEAGDEDALSSAFAEVEAEADAGPASDPGDSLDAAPVEEI